MGGATVITVVGNLTGDPELRFIPSGQAVASFTVASTPRTFDRQAGQWKDGEAELLGSLRVSIRDIVSDHPPLSDDDAAAVREMTAEARAIAAAVGLLPEGAA